jgi:hypothetical protein
MTLRIKVDEDLPTAAVERLRAAGHDAVSVSEQRLSGTVAVATPRGLRMRRA